MGDHDPNHLECRDIQPARTMRRATGDGQVAAPIAAT
jgi:hypothetical protein